MAAQELPVTPPSATGTEKKVQIIERTAEDDGIGFVMVGTGTTDSAQDEAVKLFGESLLPDAVVLDNRPRDVEGNVIHDEADHEVEHEAATSREAH